jgi:hypothetical protein
MAQAVSHRPLISEAWIGAWVIPCGIYDGQSGTGTGFSQSYFVFSCQYHSTVALHAHVLPGGFTICVLVSLVQRQSRHSYMNNNKFINVDFECISEWQATSNEFEIIYIQVTESLYWWWPWNQLLTAWSAFANSVTPSLLCKYWNFTEMHTMRMFSCLSQRRRASFWCCWHLSQACLPEHELYGCTYPVMETMPCQTRHFRPLVSGHGVSGIKLCRNILLLFSVFPSLQLWLQRVWISAIQPGRERSPLSGKLALPEWTQDSQSSFNWKSFLALPSYGLDTVPVHAMMALEGRGDIAHTHSWPRH